LKFLCLSHVLASLCSSEFEICLKFGICYHDFGIWLKFVTLLSMFLIIVYVNCLCPCSFKMMLVASLYLNFVETLPSFS
jgi:hypothetical protein